MNKLQFLLLAGVLARQVAAAATPDVTLRVLPERDLVYSGGSREVVVQIEIEARKPDRGRRSPMNLAVVLDRSGSMQGAKIEKARQAACVAVDQLADDDLFSLVIYDNDTDVLIAPDRVGSSSHREELKSRIDRIRPGGGTALHAGVTVGARQIRRNLDKERVNRVILLSDGLANVGPSRTSDLARLGRELREEGIAVTTIGLGDDYNEDLMTALAEASSANYYYVKDAEKLPGIFSEELGSARSLLARGLTIRITVPEGVRLKEIIGRPEIECRGRHVEIALPELFGAEKRKFLARCAVEESSTEPLEVAAIDLNYETADGARAPVQSQGAKVRFTDEARQAEDSLKPDVAREVSVVQNRLSKELAVKLADEGKAKDAVSVLRSQAQANAAAPAAAQLPGLAEENRKLESAARELDDGGRLLRSSRKGIQYENWQDKYQKR
ncbi:MAG: Ca-activated chloride channel [Chthoniobacter sp.]|jgi:Ca-activated chloride channel family protein|nr:Ca-activated chloride channel [Chthoniobacter sp.]